MTKTTYPTIGVVVPTWKGRHHLSKCLSPFILSPLKPRILIIDSSSPDDSAQYGKELGVEVLTIKKEEFNHGATRELGRRHLNTDIIVMVTQDCYAEDRHTLGKLISPLLDGSASIAYAKQRPHFKAPLLEKFPRYFNYPEKSQFRDVSSIPTHGIYTYFCSNSCAAYLNRALDEVGGFESVLLGEDTIATAKLLKRGHKIAYVAEATVRHSHNFTLKEEFKRNFAIGYARHKAADILSVPGGDTKRGVAFTKALLKQVIREKPQLLPYAIIQTSLKWLGYQMGRRAENLPHWLRMRLGA